MHNSVMRQKILFILILVIIVLGCAEENKNTFFKKDDTARFEHPSLQWFLQDSNYLKPSYESKFYAFYNSCLEKRNLQLAKDLLEIVCNKRYGYRNYDHRFKQTLYQFYLNHVQSIPRHEINFIHNFFGDYYVDECNFTQALKWYKMSIPSDVIDYASCEEMGYTYFNIAYCYYSMGQQDLALQNNRIAERYYKRTNNLNPLMHVESNYAIIYLATKQLKLAKLHNEKALRLCNKMNEKPELFYNLEDKIYIHSAMNDPRLFEITDSIYRLFQKSQLKEPTLNITLTTLYTREALKAGRIKEVESILRNLEPIVDSVSSTNSTQQFLVAKSELSLAKDKKINDKELILKTIDFLTKNRDYYKIIDFCSILKSNAIEQNDFKTALKYEQLIRDAKDSLGTVEISQKILELDKKYHSSKQNQKLLASQKSISKQNLTIALLITVILLFVFGGITFFTVMEKKKLEKEQQLANSYTRNLLNTAEAERKRIATDLHDSIGHELLTLKSLIIKAPEDANSKIDTVINDLRQISRNLHPVLFEKIGLTASIEQLIDRTQRVNQFMLTGEIDYHNTLSTADELHIYRIIQEAVSNCLKYSQAEAAKITFTEDFLVYTLEFKDNGIGFNVEEQLKKGNSSGLINIIERCKVLNGTVRFQSNSNGTQLFIQIPKRV